MRILYLGDQAFDYVSDPLYIGLSRLLGNDQVVDYPYKSLYHDPSCCNWYMDQRPGHVCVFEEIVEMLRNRAFDLMCVASFRGPCLEELSRLNGLVPFPPMVFIDGADDSRIRQEFVERYPVGIYFKRDYIWTMGTGLSDLIKREWAFRGDRSLFARTLPLPVSLILEVLPGIGQVCKDIDISYTGRASHPRRARAAEILSHMNGVRFEGGIYASPEDRKYKLVAGCVRRLYTKLFQNDRANESDQKRKKGPEVYYHEIARSKIALAIRGGGATPSPRYYEIAAMKTLLLSDMPETVIPNNFVNREHAVFCKPDLSDLESLVRYYLREDEEREAIACQGHVHLLKYHTCERRAEYFLEACRRIL